MINIVLIAPPAAGKGTQSALIKEKYCLSHISTGDLLREIAITNKDIAEKLSKGDLITDEIMFELLENKIRDLDSKKGHIFDGFPRTLSQAKELNNILSKFNQKIDVVIYLDVDRRVATDRESGIR